MNIELYTEEIILKLKNSLPTIFARKEIKHLFGGTISAGTLANMAVRGEGPPFVKNGRHAIYEKESFLNWYQSNLKFETKIKKGVNSNEKI